MPKLSEIQVELARVIAKRSYYQTEVVRLQKLLNRALVELDTATREHAELEHEACETFGAERFPKLDGMIT
jgi:hypothetical protein